MPVIISDWLEKLGGSQDAQKVADVLGQYWVIKPLERSPHGVQGTINEYVATKLAIKLGLPVPSIDIGYLDPQVIALYPMLSSYQPGLVLACQFEDGVDLELARKTHMLSYIRTGLYDVTNQVNAVGIMVGDTWLANLDRSVGSLQSVLPPPTSNEGNLYFKQDGLAWSVRAIDYGHSFLGASWGTPHIGVTWPFALLGTMTVFFEMGWFTKQLRDRQSELDHWLGELARVDVQSEISSIVSTLPAAWVSALSPVSGADWNDLIARLKRHQQATGGVVNGQYATVAAKH